VELSVSVASSDTGPQRLTIVHWLIIFVACVGFAFDSYELLMFPLIARPALSELLGADLSTAAGSAQVLNWTTSIFYASAVSGGLFGLLGGYLTDRFGRRRVLTWSILLYAFSALATAYSTSAWMLLILRCTTFIGVCVEFVAAVAWLAELFPNPEQRERILGYTQAFSSVGGIAVTGVNKLLSIYAVYLPAIGPEDNVWRYTLISGVIPALPLIAIRPWLPESPMWQMKKLSGTLKRPSIAELFQPAYLRTTIVTTVLMASCYGVAYGAIQLTPQMVPRLVPELSSQLGPLRKKIAEQPLESAERGDLRKELRAVQGRIGEEASGVQLYQETGGFVGRVILAWLAVQIVGRRKLLRLFQIPGLILIPLVFLFPAAGQLPSGNIEWLKAGIFVTGVLTVAQFSYWGNYLPRVYPVHLRGTGESFAANVGGRMIGTSAGLLTSGLVMLMPDTVKPSLAYGAAAVAFLCFLMGNIFTFWLPEPKQQELPD
jgi:MFS family permease